jgi:hypothetical protein
MNERIEPDEAARALVEVRSRQQRAVQAGVVPGWFWVSVAILVVVLSAGVDARRPLLVGLAATVFALGLVATVGLLVVRLPVQIRNELIGPVGVLMIVGFVLALVGVTIGIAFTLRAAGLAYPATWASLFCAAGLVVGGPWLMRRLRAVVGGRTVGSFRR